MSIEIQYHCNHTRRKRVHYFWICLPLHRYQLPHHSLTDYRQLQVRVTYRAAYLWIVVVEMFGERRLNHIIIVIIHDVTHIYTAQQVFGYYCYRIHVAYLASTVGPFLRLGMFVLGRVLRLILVISVARFEGLWQVGLSADGPQRLLPLPLVGLLDLVPLPPLPPCMHLWVYLRLGDLKFLLLDDGRASTSHRLHTQAGQSKLSFSRKNTQAGHASISWTSKGLRE